MSPDQDFKMLNRFGLEESSIPGDIYRAEECGLICTGLGPDRAGKRCTRLARETQQRFDSKPGESSSGREPMDIKELWIRLQVCTVNKVSLI